MKSAILITSLITACTFAQAQATTTLAKQTTSSFITSDYAKTKNPIVFAHGLFGFGSVVGIDYFYQILPDLARNGANSWYTTVSPMNSSEVRGEQLLQQVNEILALTGKSQVNLIGHSHGGQSVRYVAGVAPTKVASVTTIASGNKGAKLADLILQLIEGNLLEQPVRAVFDTLVSPVLVYAQGLDAKTFPFDSKAAVDSLSTAGSLAFNHKFPGGVPTTSCGEGSYQANGTYFYSFMGNSAFNTPLDPVDYSAVATSLLINNNGDNDGIVARCDARFGRVINDRYQWNHFDEINHLLGIKSIFAPSAVDVYRQHANRLKLQGL